MFQNSNNHSPQGNSANNKILKRLSKMHVLFGMLTFLLLSCLCGILVYQRYLIKEENRKQATNKVLLSAIEKIQVSLAQSIAATKTLSFFINEEGQINNFDEVASHILSNNNYIDAIQLLPDGIVKNIFPLKGNEAAIGHNILKDSIRKKEAIRAIYDKKFYFAGPYKLQQGGIAVLGRLPIQRKGNFWGFCTVIIKLSTLLKSAEIDNSYKTDYYFQLSKLNPLTHNNEFFLPQLTTIKNANYVSANVPNTEWKLTATPIEKYEIPVDVLLVALLGFILAILGGWFVSMIVKKPHQLNDLVNKRTTELLSSENNYRSLFEQATDGIVIIDLNGVITQVNKSICLLLGYQEVELLNKKLSDFFPVEDQINKPVRIALLLEGKSLIYERVLIDKYGTQIPVEVSSKMVTSNSFIGMIRDITERKTFTEQLKKSNERYELINKVTNDAIWDYDVDKDEIDGNENYFNLYGLKKGVNKISQHNFQSNLHADDKELVLSNFRNIIAQKKDSFSDQFCFKMPDGSFKNFSNHANVFYNENNLPVRIVGALQDITESVKIRQHIINEKELTDAILDNLPALFLIFDATGKFLKWSKSLETVLGYSKEEIAKLSPLDLFESIDQPLVAIKMQNVFKVGYESIEANLITKNLITIPYMFSGKIMEYHGERCVLGFGVDFTNKVNAENALKESEEKFRSLVQQADDTIVIMEAEGKPIYISPAFERIIGFSGQELMEMDLFTLLHPDDATQIHLQFEEALKNQGLPIKSTTYRIIHKDGSVIWAQNTITNLVNIPSIHGIVVNVKDITERVLNEKKINDEKELSDSIINSLPGIFFLCNESGQFIRWNKNFETISGYSAAEIMKMMPKDFYETTQHSKPEQRIEDLFNKKMPPTESVLLTKDGRNFPMLLNSTYIEYEGIRSVVGTGVDVSDRKKMEQDLLNSNQQLEQTAFQLKTSYAELERFAYIASHDLQEPLRMVSSFLKLLEKKYKGRLDDAADKYIHFAVDGADRMKELITNLLEYSRSGTTTDIADETDMNEVMVGVKLVLQDMIEQQHAILEIGDLPALPHTSKIQLVQLMQNLVSNALKYRSNKYPVIKIEAIEEVHQWVFSIQDNGIGIDPKFSEKIFVIFQRLHNKNEYSGTGIGLSICKKIVEKLGGKIWVEASIGNGSTFYFTIPKIIL